MSVYISIARFKQFIASVEKTIKQLIINIDLYYRIINFISKLKVSIYYVKAFLCAGNYILKVLSDKFLPCGSAFLNALPASIKFVAASCLLCI